MLSDKSWGETQQDITIEIIALNEISDRDILLFVYNVFVKFWYMFCNENIFGFGFRTARILSKKNILSQQLFQLFVRRISRA